MGPILHFSQLLEKRWIVTALVITADAKSIGPITYAKREAKAENIGHFGRFTAWRYEMPLKMTDADRKVKYSTPDGRSFHFFVPALGEVPTYIFGR